MNAINRFNNWLATKITNGVSTMWCAYAFTALAFYGLPAALKPGGEGLVAWIAQTFLQLVLLSVIMVGQKSLGSGQDDVKAAIDNHAASMEHHHETLKQHLGITKGGK